MRIIIANWKMKFTIKESLNFLRRFKKQKLPFGVEVVLAPSFISLKEVGEGLKKTSLKLGAQDVFWQEKGAFTGEISPEMLKETRVEYVIVGHSERRQWLKETDEMINAKIVNLLKNDLMPVVCVGETWQEKNENLTEKVICRQIKVGFRNIKTDKTLVIAYEPVWAIGTGRPAFPEDAAQMHQLIRKCLEKIFGREAVKKNARVIYGGSVNAQNTAAFAKEEGIDGFLVGGASLDPEEFYKIIKACQSKNFKK